MKGITDEDADVIVSIERGCSVISLMGCLFVLITFSCSSAFRQRAINRMVFFATFGNMLTNVATLMTRTYTNSVDSFGCQVQAFLIQVFMQGDAYWALAMAVNVYLTFYHKFDAKALRKMEIPYWLACYGIPFVPGFTYLFVRTEAAGRPYGNAVLWCWLKPEWEVYRIATFYGPVWVAIVIATSIYIRAGREIYKKRKKMLNFGSSAGGTVTNHNEPFSPTTDIFAPAFKTTEVVQTTEIVQKPNPSTAGIPSETGPTKNATVSYSVTISAEGPMNDNDSLDGLDDTDTAAGSVQSTTNNPNHTRPSSTVQPPPTGVANIQARRRFQRNLEAHKATWSYAKCAILFFAVLLITWIPSSGNRVYSLINDGEVSRPLFFASAFVLPLQGLWNAIIYSVTSWSACKEFFWGILSIVATRSRRPIVEITASRHRDSRTPGNMWKTAEETTSMEDLTGSSRTLRVDRASPV